MRLVRHLVRHDLAPTAKMLIVWVAVLGLQSAVLWIGPPEPVSGMIPSPGLDQLAIILRLALTVVLVPTIVHRQPLVGSVAFWRTRPIPPASLLAAKSLFIFVAFAAAPFAWFLLTFIAMDVSADLAVRGAAAVALEQGVFIGLSWVTASVTRTMPQYVVGLLGVFVVSIAGTAGRFLGSFTPFVIRVGDWETSESLVLWLVVGALGLVAAHQHLSRRTWRTITIAVLLIGAFWLRPWRVDLEPPRERLSALPAVAAGTIDFGSIRTQSVGQSGKTEVEVSALIRSAPATPAIILRPVGGTARLALAPGTTLEVSQPADSSSIAEPLDEPGTLSQPYLAIAVATGASLLSVDAMTPFAYRRAILSVPAATYSTWGSTPGTLSVRQLCEAVSYRASSPMRLGARVRTPDGTFVFEQLARTSYGVAVVVRAAQVQNWAREPGRFVLRNSDHREAMTLTQSRWQQYRTTVLVQQGLVVTRSALDATFVTEAGTAASVTAAWLAGAELVHLASRVVGKADWTTQVPDFKMNPGAAQGADMTETGR